MDDEEKEKKAVDRSKKIKIRIGRAETTTHKTLLPVSRRLRDRQDVAMLLYVDLYQ